MKFKIILQLNYLSYCCPGIATEAWLFIVLEPGVGS